MSHIKNREAYFRTMVKNMDKNEYRANDNFFNHIDSVGDETDIRQKSVRKRKVSQMHIPWKETFVKPMWTIGCCSWITNGYILHFAA